jgi:polyhydroxyalkanoate synthesis regulator phasin
MFETFRKAVLFGLGAAVASTDRLKKMVDDLVERGEVTAEEGRKLFEDMVSYAEQNKAEISTRIGGHVRESLRDMGMAEHSQVTTLEQRIEALETRIKHLEHEGSSRHKTNA